MCQLSLLFLTNIHTISIYSRVCEIEPLLQLKMADSIYRMQRFYLEHIEREDLTLIKRYLQWIQYLTQRAECSKR